MHTWRCPCCPDFVVESASEGALESAVANHIRAHENKVALQAVDRARIDCSNTGCELGKTKRWDLKDNTWKFKLTDFDKRWLQSLHISTEPEG